MYTVLYRCCNEVITVKKLYTFDWLLAIVFPKTATRLTLLDLELLVHNCRNITSGVYVGRRGGWGGWAARGRSYPPLAPHASLLKPHNGFTGPVVHPRELTGSAKLSESIYISMYMYLLCLDIVMLSYNIVFQLL